MKTLLALIFTLLFLSSSVFADRWYCATAYDTEIPPYESGQSNTVQTVGWFHISITFEWTPNTEPDICGYNIYVKDSPDGEWVLVNVEIFHLDYCLDICQRTLSIEPITSIILKEDSP